MRLSRVFPCALLALLFSSLSVLAQDNAPHGSAAHTPSLGDLMAVVQLRHAKMWYAATLRNWPLADYELRQLKAGLKETTRLYPKMPGADMTGIEKAADTIDESIRARSSVRFEKAFTELTSQCNGCHHASDRAFIVVRRPILPSPYSNQVFAPAKR
jgi:hypothetical protein